MRTIDRAMANHGLFQDVMPTAHVTASYRAPRALHSTPIAPIDWLIDEIHLVATHHEPFRYEIVASSRLSPPQVRRATQLALPL